jgi:SAM-dependent methyltransferase
VLLDQSLDLIRKAKRRLLDRSGAVPHDLVFFLADALRLPFRAASFGTILSLNLLHVLSEPSVLLEGLRRVLAPGGTFFLTTLVKGGRRADAYLSRLGRSGYLVPRSTDEVRGIFEQAGLNCEHALSGNLATLRGAEDRPRCGAAPWTLNPSTRSAGC